MVILGRGWGGAGSSSLEKTRTKPLPNPLPQPSSPVPSTLPHQEFSISWPLFVFAFVSLSPLDGFLFISKLSGAVHQGDSVLGCLYF